MSFRLGIAAALSLLLHLLLGVALVLLRPFEAAEGSPPPESIEVSLVRPSEPTFFTELPEDRADEAPEAPDFLSNVDSRARDEAAGGDDRLPQSDGESDAPQIAMRKGEPVPPVPEAPEAEDTEPQPREADRRERTADRAGETPPADPADAPSLTPLREQFASQSVLRPHPAGTSDIFQEAMKNPSAGAALEGSVTLNTTAWEYAPWMQAFRRKVEERWHAPMAWRMGLIAGDLTVRIEIARNGDLVKLTVLEQDVGHPSLTDAVLYAVREGARYRALPSNFPEETLIMRYTFVYPQVRHR